MAAIADIGYPEKLERVLVVPLAAALASSEPRVSLRLQKEAAAYLSETLVADAVSFALNSDGRSLRALARETGLDAAFLCRLAAGKNCTISSLALLALALGKKLHVSIE